LHVFQVEASALEGGEHRLDSPPQSIVAQTKVFVADHDQEITIDKPRSRHEQAMSQQPSYAKRALLLNRAISKQPIGTDFFPALVGHQNITSETQTKREACLLEPFEPLTANELSVGTQSPPFQRRMSPRTASPKRFSRRCCRCLPSRVRFSPILSTAAETQSARGRRTASGC